MPGVGDVKSFIKEFSLVSWCFKPSQPFIKEFNQRLIDCFKQDWHSALESHDFYNVYSNFNHSLVRSLYLSLLNNISV